MLTVSEIQTALTKLVTQNTKIKDVWFDRVNYPSEDEFQNYAWIELRPNKTSFDKVYYQRLIAVDIHIILKPDENGEVSRTEIYEIIDQLDAAIMPCLQIKDRFITIQNFRADIFDNVLHYEFTLDFTDYIQSDEYEGLAYELMKNLKMELNKETPQSVFIVYEGDD
ncbi:MAG: hypothetical protein IJ728_04890 [Selenomonadaceae bacterium]|nr:hypothetical protein [Selenomonadaceae bacterium]